MSSKERVEGFVGLDIDVGILDGLGGTLRACVVRGIPLFEANPAELVTTSDAKHVNASAILGDGSSTCWASSGMALEELQ
jgi:hypothetical protein